MYYRLTYIESSDKNRRGDSVLNGNKPLSVGQTFACEVQLPESELYEPQVYATILKHEGDAEWYIVCRTDCHRVLVNGATVAVAQILKNGDILNFDDGIVSTKLKFEIFDDGEYNPGRGVVYKKNKSNRLYFVVAFFIAFAAFGLAAYSVLMSRQVELRYMDLKQLNQSVYQVTTDSVYLLSDGVVIDSLELKEVAAGTAFLAKDSGNIYFVTARHCIEPWINDDEWDGVSRDSLMSPEVKMATWAETNNAMAGYERYTLRSHLVISKGLERYNYYSTDFLMNKTRDMVLKLGSDNEVIYYRSIIPIAHRRDMELGDFAYIKLTSQIKPLDEVPLSMANWHEIVSFTNSKNQDIAVLGYPLNDNDADGMTVVYGNHTGMAYSDSIDAPTGCLQMSAPINRGNSGGPVVAFIGHDLKVIGIVSKSDERANQGMFWAVPTAEVLSMHFQGDKVIEDSVTYRR